MYLEEQVSKLNTELIQLRNEVNELKTRDHHPDHETITQKEAHSLLYGDKTVTAGAISTSMKKLVAGGYIHVMRDGGQNFYDRDEILDYKKSRMITGKAAIMQ